MTRREVLFSLGGLGGAALVAKRSYAGGTEALPSFWKSHLTDVDFALGQVKKGRVRVLAKSPGQRNLYVVTYGEKDNLASTANYNSACGGNDPASYRRKDGKQKPVVFLLGPVHGGEFEGVVGLNNLLCVAETGQDLRGRKWPDLQVNLDRCRVLIVPVGNPDGRARCPVDSWVGADSHTYERIGMGTRPDGTNYVWPMVKRFHPMRGAAVGTLGAYFNDDGVNLMHDEWFEPMAEETRTYLRLAREEAPDFVAILHSHESLPSIEPTAYVPRTVKETIRAFANQLYARYRAAGLPAREAGPEVQEDGAAFPPPSFNLASALHHACGGTAFIHECTAGAQYESVPKVTHEQILDFQMIMYDELFRFAVEHPVRWV
jgi:zinc carboxypeptidase